MDQGATFNIGGSSASSASASASASRRNSFTYLEKPDGISTSFTSFSSLKGLASPRLLPMPVVTTASSAIELAKSWLPSPRGTHLPSYAPLSPFSQTGSPSPRVRAFLGNCLYRRTFIWGASIVSALIFLVFLGRHNPEPFHFSHVAPAGPSAEDVWLNYTRLDGYFQGIRSIVPIGQYKTEFPTPADQELARLETSGAATNARTTSETSIPADENADLSKRDVPLPRQYSPQPDYNAPEYLAKYYPVTECTIDAAGTIPVPKLWAYDGVPQGQPEPLMGSHQLFGMRDDVCFDRFGRYGPYGLGYSTEEGGTGEGMDTESEGSWMVWSKEGGKIDYTNVDWAAAQKRCFEANKQRFVAVDPETVGVQEYPGVSGELRMTKPQTRDNTTFAAANLTKLERTATAANLKKLERTAIVVRCYAGFKWTPHAVLNFRALVAEVSLQSGGEYDVHILLDARDDSLPIWADAETTKSLIEHNIPPEFRGLVTPWSVAQMRLLYPGLFGQPVFDNPSGHEIHGVYRSPHLPLQHFAQQHPEYAHYWNWEMDMRFLGSYYEFFDRLDKWSAAQQRRRVWDRSAKYYVPALHGSWENFTAQVDAEAHEAGRPSLLGEVFFAGRTATRDEERGISPLPAGCEGAVLSPYNRTAPESNGTDAKPKKFFADRNNNYTNIPEQCGVGEAADIITLNPMFDSQDSGWFFANDVTGYDTDFAIPPRRTALITASRLSRRLLFAMHEETWRLHHGMFAEMFPPSVALHRGFKGVYAPHPVYVDRRWPLNAVERAFNGGPDHSSGASHDSPFLPDNEHYHRGLSWYYNAAFGGRLWRRWLGYLQPLDDDKVPRPTGSGNNTLEDNLLGLGGGAGEEMRDSGRMCMRSVLVHPIKFESLAEIMP